MLDTETAAKFDRQGEMLGNRVKKRFAHLHNHFARQQIDVFRLYDWDIPEIRAVVDWYAGHLVVGEYVRRQSLPEWLPLMGRAVARALSVPPERVHLKARRAGRLDGKRYGRIANTGQKIVVSERDLKFTVNPYDYVDTGLFADHRNTRQMVRELAEGRDFLNLFCYTGSFSCYAAKGGARSTLSVDRSETAIRWARENFALNGMDTAGNVLVQADVFDFCKTAGRRGDRFDLAVVDPPSFSTTRVRNAAFDVVLDHPRLLAAAIGLMRPGGTLFFSTNHQDFTPRLEELPLAAAEEITRFTVPEDYISKRKQIHRCWRITVGADRPAGHRPKFAGKTAGKSDKGQQPGIPVPQPPAARPVAGARPFEYQRTRRFFAQTAGGVEPLAVAEISALGGRNPRPGHYGASFGADPAVLYRVNYGSRLATRVLAPLRSFACRDREDLYAMGSKIEWQALFSPDNTFAVTANVSGNAQIPHSRFAALVLKDAIADAFRSRCGRRPSVHRTTPDVWVNLHIKNQRAAVSLDTSGGSLHRRGYRRQSVVAPMAETLAALMVNLAGWQGEKPLVDPMCGSGTLLCEALMAHCRIPAGFLRDRFGFSFLPDYDAGLWASVRSVLDQGIRELPPGLISGSDIDPTAVDAALANLPLLPQGDAVRLSRKAFQDIPNLENRMILCNPPYGIRLEGEADLGRLYRDFGDFLKQRCRGSSAVVFFGNREMIKRVGLKPAWRRPFKNAGLDGRIVRYDIY